MVHLDFSRIEYFLFNWISLNAERARYPCSLVCRDEYLGKKMDKSLTLLVYNTYPDDPFPFSSEPDP